VTPRAALGAAVTASLALGAMTARADSIVPPWGDPHDVPLPPWGKSVAPLRPDVPIAEAPGKPDAKRGTIEPGARLPLYGSARGAACGGRWLLVGPMAWVCSDAVEVSGDAPQATPMRGAAAAAEGLPYRYFFVGPDGAEAFVNLPTGSDGAHGVEAPDETLDPGFAVGIAEEADARGVRWGRTRHGEWIPMRELTPFRTSPFQGEKLAANAPLDVAWVVADAASVYATLIARGRPAHKRARFDRVTWHEERAAGHGGGAMVRVSDDGATPEQWMRARDLAHPTLSAPPEPIGGANATSSWIDIDLGAQTLVAYEGTRPVFATLVSTGRGAPGDAAATPEGIHRIGAKLTTNDMDNLELDEGDEGPESVDTIDDVPYVQYFDHGVALFGTFWHRDLGRPHGRAGVSLAPKDAAWLFAFTSPHLPPGWSAAYPTPLEPGTVVRVRTGESIARDFPLDKPRGTVIHKPSVERPDSP
jgi:lipoprotein-anchoring transpeptidase ErfK/SrfK